MLKLERLVTSDSFEPDSVSAPFYQFKPYPGGIKRSEIDNWVILQRKLLNPYQSLHCYHHTSAKGLHLWYAQEALKGIPETALQQPLENGEHTVKGQQHCYYQQWQHGVMTACMQTSNSTPSVHIKVNNRVAWAKIRPLKTHIRRPLMWSWLLGFMFICVCVWVVSARISLSVQLAHLEENIANKSDTLGNKLLKESALRDTRVALDFFPVWQNEHGYFPAAFGLIAESLLANGTFTPNNIRWQNKKLELEFKSTNMNLTALVASLEDNSAFVNVSLRPHNDDNTWMLEAQLQ